MFNPNCCIKMSNLVILYLIFVFLEIIYDDTVSSYSEIDEDLLKKFGYQKNISSSPVS